MKNMYHMQNISKTPPPPSPLPPPPSQYAKLYEPPPIWQKYDQYETPCISMQKIEKYVFLRKNDLPKISQGGVPAAGAPPLENCPA